MDYSYLKSQSQTAFESVCKVQEKIQAKLSDTFENQDKKPQGQFDITKLENIKEKTNKNFFDRMETLKTTKKPIGSSNGQSAPNDDLLDLEASGKKQAKKDDDFFNLDFTNPAPVKVTPQPLNLYSNIDLLASNEKIPQTKAMDHDLLLDFQTDLTITKPTEKKQLSVIDDDMFRGLSTSVTHNANNNENKTKVAINDKDPFDFIAF